MEEKEISVKELVKMIPVVGYLQEVRLFTFGSIYNYITYCYKHSGEEYSEEKWVALINEAEEAIEELLNDGIISYVYPEGLCGLYRVNDKIDLLEVSKLNQDYLKDMTDVLLDIHGGEPKLFTLTLSGSRKK